MPESAVPSAARPAERAARRGQQFACTALLGLLTAPAFPVAGPGLGQALSAAEVAAININVFPNGAGLPPGRGTVAAGQALYAARCEACHGVRGSGGSADELAGGEHGLRGNPPDKTIGTYWPYATTLFDYIRRSMPPSAPRSLSDDEVYALTAYLLSLNGIIDEGDALDAVSLARIRMPNRDGFIPVDAR
ncbi:cytochrome c [Methylolobus aquaticus]|nr:cytochrome c [Methylolobus aquaticus]